MAAALLASFLPFREASTAEVQAPILQPRMIYIPISIPISPWFASRTMILTVTEELWMMAVSTAPRITAKKGVLKEANICTTAGESFMPDMAPDIVLSPMNRTPKPMMTSPQRDSFSFLQNITISTPVSRMTGAAFSSLNETRSAVTVVPIFAPKITPAACVSVISPELTKLTTITVHAEEDWITAVKKIPTRIPVNLFVVSFSSMPLSFAPATFSMLSLIIRMPYRKSPRPPARESMIVGFICIRFPSYYVSLSRRMFHRQYTPATIHSIENKLYWQALNATRAKNYSNSATKSLKSAVPPSSLSSL